MAFIQLAFSLIILGILYLRMIRREIPDTIKKPQALVPILFGILSIFLSFGILIFIGVLLKKAGLSSSDLPGFISSVISAFLTAGLPEETAKLLMILAVLRIFRSKIRNVYEYILIGAAVGFGFTLLEEFLYGSDSGAVALFRLITIAAHMTFGIIMAKHLGTARYNRITGSGSVTGEYVLAIIIPILIHTLYDAGTATNKYMYSSDDDIVAIGMAIALAFTIAMFIIQIVVLVKTKKKTERYCGMVFGNKQQEVA